MGKEKAAAIHSGMVVGHWKRWSPVLCDNLGEIKGHWDKF